MKESYPTLNASKAARFVATGPADSDQAMVCYCYRLTAGAIKQAFIRCGSIEQLQRETRAGTGCNGCRVMVQSLCGAEVESNFKLASQPLQGTHCSRPGNRIMKVFVVSNGDIESVILASNGVAPQLGDCDASTNVEYALLNHKGEVKCFDRGRLRTGETFQFDTSSLILERPFFGIFMLGLERSNFGAARLNVQWRSKNSIASTHENASTGRPRVFLPIIINHEFLRGPNSIYLGIMNPHGVPVRFVVEAFDPHNHQNSVRWESYLAPNCSTWVNANTYFYAPALNALSSSEIALKIESKDCSDIHSALTTYFFFHNSREDLWSVQHL